MCEFADRSETEAGTSSAPSASANVPLAYCNAGGASFVFCSFGPDLSLSPLSVERLVVCCPRGNYGLLFRPGAAEVDQLQGHC